MRYLIPISVKCMVPFPGGIMKHYRVNKLAKPDGEIVKAKDILANDDNQALQTARDDADCPICDVLHNGKKVGSVI